MNLIEFRLWLMVLMGEEDSRRITCGLEDPDDFRVTDSAALEPASVNASLMGSPSPSPQEMAVECDRWAGMALDARTSRGLRRLATQFARLDPTLRVPRPGNVYEFFLNTTTGEFDVDWTLSPLLPSVEHSNGSVETWLARLQENRDQPATYGPGVGKPLYVIDHPYISQYFEEWVDDLLHHGGTRLRVRPSPSSPLFRPDGLDYHVVNIAITLYIITGRKPRIALKEPRQRRIEAWISLD